jgi:hypothetical protein
MSYYFLIPFLIICIIADFLIMQRGLFNNKPDFQFRLIFFILFLPVMWLLLELDYSFHPLENIQFINKKTFIGFIVKTMLIIIAMLFVETVLYLLIRKFAHRKSRIDKGTA